MTSMWWSIGCSGAFVLACWIYTRVDLWRFHRRLAARARETDAYVQASRERVAAMWAKIDRDWAAHLAEFPIGDTPSTMT